MAILGTNVSIGGKAIFPTLALCGLIVVTCAELSWAQPLAPDDGLGQSLPPATADPASMSASSCGGGSLPGRFAVSKTGEATYQIPIAVPPGSAGLSPELSLYYSNQSGDGLLGMGWSLSGLSKIIRCAANTIQDGYVAGVGYGQDDRFCLDGLKLVAVQGIYGGNGTEYRTDPETFTRVISYEIYTDAFGKPYGPKYFKAWTKSGQVIEFGGNSTSDDGRIERVIFNYQVPSVSSEGVRVWAASRISDRTGKYMEISYYQDKLNVWASTGEYWPTEIRYTGNTNRAPYNKVTFEYELRPNLQVVPVYEQGGRIKPEKRLSHVKTYENNNLVLDYGLQYDPAPQLTRSRLVSLVQCDSANNCLPATTFSWQNDGLPQLTFNAADSLMLQSSTTANLYTAVGMQANINTYVSEMLHNNISDVHVRTGADVNGDGRADLILIEGGIYNSVADTQLYNPSTLKFEVASTGSALGQWNDFSYTRYLTMDVTGDGKTDIVAIHYDQQRDMTVARVYQANLQNGFDYLSTSDLPGVNYFGVYLQPANLNGDAKADLIGFQITNGTFGAGQEAIAFTSNGTGFDKYSLSMTNVPNEPTLLGYFNPNTPTKLLTADVNGDGLTDIVFVQPGRVVSIIVFLSTPHASSKFTQTIPTSSFYASAFPSGGTTLADFYILPMDVNGDGNEDITVIGRSDALSTVMYSFLSDGMGRFTELVPSPPHFAQMVDPVWTPGFQGFYPGDFNGDGRTDFLYLNHTSNKNRAELWISKGADLGGTVFEQFSNSSPLMTGDPNAVYLMQDITGDGKTDAVRIDSQNAAVSFDYHSYATAPVSTGYLTDIQVAQAWIRAFPSQGVIPDILISITDGFGLQTNITYAPATSAAVYQGPSGPLNDAETRNSQGPRYLVASYTTSDGLGGSYAHHYQYRGAKTHSSYGFLGFERVTVSEPQADLELETKYFQLFPMTGMIEEMKRRIGGIEVYLRQDVVGATNLGNRSVAEVYARREIERELDGAVLRDSWTVFQYDAYFNVITETTDWASGHEERSQSYVNDDSQWLLGLPSSTKISRKVPGQTALDQQTLRVFGATSGLLNQETRLWVTSIFPPKMMTWTAQYTYDVDGNRTTSTISGSDFAGRIARTTYDAQGRFPLSTQNPAGHVETRTFDGRFGALASSKDANGAATQWAYDGFGRRATEIRPDGSISTWQYCAVPFGVSTPANSTHAVDVQTTNASRVTTYMDALDRVIRTATDGFGGNIVFVDKQFNALGQMSRRALPYFSFSSIGPSNWWEYQYDGMGRLVKEIGPDLTATVTEFAGPATPLATTLTLNAGDVAATIRKNQKGQAFKTLYDSQGRVIQSQSLDSNGTVLAYASYEYDSFGHLTKVADPNGNIIQMDYDLPGRRVALRDPDLGTRTFQYNMAGEMTGMQGPAGAITMTYDVLGRLTSRSEPEGQSTWKYDTAPLGVGKLASVTAPGSLSESYEYNAIGKVARVNTKFGTIYRTEYAYDGNSRVSSIRYPGSTGFQVQNTYDSAGYLQEIRDAGTNALYWKAEGRNAAGMLTQQRLGNGDVSVFDYDVYQRRIGIRTGPGGSVQKLSYAYDLDNVSMRSDGLVPIDENFQFDDMGRLRKTDQPARSYSISYQYDPAGNLLNKQGVGAYEYGVGAGPHAVTSVTQGAQVSAITYDRSGNMLTGFGRKLGWYSFGKPKQVINGAVTMNFTYNQNREKVRQVLNVSGLLRITQYVGRLYERTIGVSERYNIFADGNIVAVNTAPGTTLYLHDDHLRSLESVTNQSGALIEKKSFDPHGLQRNLDWTPASGALSSVSTISFTGHENLANVGLIDMRGRLYDPVLGRFLSPDPYIPDYRNPQSFNRYAYVNNNPVSRTDPTGFQSKPAWTTDLDAAVIFADAPRKSLSPTFWEPQGGWDYFYWRQELRQRADFVRAYWDFNNPEKVRGLTLDNTPFLLAFPVLGKLAGLVDAGESVTSLASGEGTVKDLATIYFGLRGLGESVSRLATGADLDESAREGIVGEVLEHFSLGFKTGERSVQKGSVQGGSLSAAPPDHTRVVVGEQPRIDYWQSAVRLGLPLPVAQ